MKRYKKLISYTLYTLLVAFLFTACSDKIDLKSGEMKHIPYTKNYAISTDSTIVIINRETGKTLNVIKRTYKSK